MGVASGRDALVASARAPQTAFPFSMRDLCLLDRVRELRDAGVASLKIEGRMKSPLYVAAATDLYRRKLDGILDPGDERKALSDFQTIFSRPYTHLYLDGRDAAPEGIVDAKAVGHRGALIGHVQAVRRDRDGSRWLAFATRRPLEAHDGIQIDLPEGGRPFGFAVDGMRLAGDSRRRIAVPLNACVELALPRDAPPIPHDAPIYCAASQAVRRAFAIEKPRAAELRAASPVEVRVTLAPDALRVSAVAVADARIRAEASVAGEFQPARDPFASEAAVRRAFERMGDTRWALAGLSLEGDVSLFAPASLLNELRRGLCAKLDAVRAELLEEGRSLRATSVAEALAEPLPPPSKPLPARSAKVRVERPPEAMEGYGEIVLDLTVEACRDVPALLRQTAAWKRLNGAVRIALPLIVRGAGESDAVENAALALLRAGFADWECDGLAGWRMLRRLGGVRTMTAGASLYGFNRIALRELAGMGFDAVVAPAECDIGQLEELAASAPGRIIVPLRIRPPLFVSETRPVLPWCRDGRYAAARVQDGRGHGYDIEGRDGRWTTRDADPIDRRADEPRLRAAGAALFRDDFTDFSGQGR